MSGREWYRGCGFCKPKKLGLYAEVDVPKRITTINVPIIYQNALQKLVDMELFDSMSQIIRTCLERFLQKEILFKEDIKTIPKKRKKAIMTVNLPIEDREIIAREFVDNFVGAEPLYPSRSEVLRTAIRDFLMSIYNMKMEELEPELEIEIGSKIWNIGRAI